ncbi:G-protein coupled receptor GRL101-like isoform X2 [Homarus americanus]|uniref:G-protein coupled receptor GRL101-like isoform X2 n=1 Tax=Homarus americanus TaxID=6706 RepID=UPI001C48BE1C|nr:G-protein coupled receptor GRL101-like isoform X2 [Homarus americanus]
MPPVAACPSVLMVPTSYKRCVVVSQASTAARTSVLINSRESYTCADTHYKCDNGFCVPRDVLCDFDDDCGDSSDEHYCLYRKCYEEEFTCGNGECVFPGFVCDGEPKCSDGSDETHCQPEDFAVCKSGRLVHRHFWCDGSADCADNHADELHCGECREDQFLCPNGRCILQGNVCDAQCDCLDCADERNCSRFYTTRSGVAVCQLGQSIRCGILTGDRQEERCVAAEYVCDGIDHCHIGKKRLSDELECWHMSKPCLPPEGEVEPWVQCSDGRCVPKSLLCNREGACPNGQDANGCPVMTCKEGEWQCFSGQCIPLQHHCDGKFYHCNDSSDERNCRKVNEKCTSDWRPCSDGRCIPGAFFCDEKVDCLNGEDEDNCTATVECGEGEWQCSSGGQCVNVSYRCDLYFDCNDTSDELLCSDHECDQDHMKCHSGQCVRRDYWCDYVVDCFDKSDEMYCEINIGCEEGQFQCASGQCIPSEDRCVVHQGTTRRGCGDGSHLLNCKGSNGTTCGEDMHRCLSGPCIHHSDICNEKINCPNTWDDESNCIFSCSKNAAKCRCFNVEANCSSLDLQEFPDTEEQINIFIFADNYLNVTLEAKPIRQNMSRAIHLDLSRNHIAHLRNDVFAHLWRLKILDLRDNHLTNLTANAFNGLLNLRSLDLSYQGLTHISSNAFLGLRKLATLSLSHNKLGHLHHKFFSGLQNLKKLDVSHNSIVTVNYNTFQHIPKLKFLVLDEFRQCCQVRHIARCVPEADEFSTCEDLMSNLVLRVSIWVLGLVALFGNTFVIIWRSAFSSFNKLNSFLIVNLALGDLLMGFYLIVVGGVDLHYRGVYAEHQLFWRTSWLCQMAGFLSTFSSELSVFTLTVITVERLRIIMHPSHNKSTKPTKLVMAGVWIVVGVLATLPLVNREYFNNFYGRSGVCLALHITQEKPSGWEYSVFIFLGLNFVSFGVIAVSYVLMYFAVRKTRMEAARISRREDENLAKRMTLIVATDAACWLPIIILGVVSLYGVDVPPKVFSWVAVFILPLNAAVNPVLYTLSTSPVRKKLGTIRQSLSSRNSGSATGIPLPPIKRPRESTLSSDVVKTSDKGTAVNTKDTVCVYKPGTAHTQDVLTCLHKSPEAV